MLCLHTGVGFNVNIPWHTAMMGDAEYRLAFDRIVMPIAREYSPDLILVSAGFDALVGDPLGEYLVTSTMYAYMTSQLGMLANGKVVLVYEGGYNPENVAVAMAACTATLLTKDYQDSGDVEASLPLETAAFKCAQDVVEAVIEVQKSYCKCFSFYRHSNDFDACSIH